MESTTQKPLPDLPDVSLVINLSIDARAHLSKFIRFALAEESQSTFSDTQREAWALTLENVHSELGDSIAGGDWLAGAKKRSQRRKLQKDASKVPEVGKKKQDKGTAVPSKGKNPSNDNPEVKVGESEHSEREDGRSRNNTRSTRSDNAGDNLGRSLNELRNLLSKATPQPSATSATSATHVLLSVAPRESGTPAEDSGFDVIPPNPSCQFKADSFTLPEDGPDEKNLSRVVLYGLDEWEGDADTIHLVGGTFHLKGVTSPEEHDILFNTLRLTVYVHLSLILEQHFLANSGVKIRFPDPELSSETPAPPNLQSAEPESTPPGVKPRRRPSLVPPGVFSFISKTGGNLVQRAASIRPLRRKGSLVDTSASASRQSRRSAEMERKPHRRRRFSLTPDNRSSPLKVAQVEVEPEHVVSAFMKSIEKNKDYLSTSVGVTVGFPPLIISLADKEKEDPTRPLSGDETVGLTSIIGWDQRDFPRAAFFLQQEISVLYSEHVPSASQPNPSLSHLMSSHSDPSISGFSTCGRPQWITYHYYSRSRRVDKCLGEVVVDLCSTSEKPCSTPGCELKLGKHQRRFVHGGLRIVADVKPLDGKMKPSDEMNLWVGCKSCGAMSPTSQVNDGTYLFSFAKYLEALVYSPTIFTLTPALCEHTTPPLQPWQVPDFPLPKSRLNIVRYFSYGSNVVSFTLSAIEDIFELRVPRLQIIHEVKEKPTEMPALDSQDHTVDGIEEKRILRREIMTWWQGVAEYMDSLEETLAGDNAAARKALPRLPSMDEPFDEVQIAVQSPEPDVSAPPPVPEKAERLHNGAQEGPTGILVTDMSQSTSTPAPQQADKDQDPAHLLSDLRHAFQRAEQTQYSQLAATPITTLNNVRWSFRSTARGATKRLATWEKKYLLGKLDAKIFHEKVVSKEPQWWRHGYYAAPGGNVIVKEGDWGSIIAYTLSSVDFRNELANLSEPSAPVASTAASPLLSPALSNQSSIFSVIKPYKFFTSSAAPQPNADPNDALQTPEPFSATISRMQHPRDPTSVLSLREVLRRSNVDVSSSSGQPSAILSGSTNTTTRPSETKPGKTTVELGVDGEPGALSEDHKTLEHAEGGGADPLQVASSLPDRSESGANADPQHGVPESVTPAKSDATVVPDDATVTNVARPPTPPPKDPPAKDDVTKPISISRAALATTSATASSLTSSFSHGFSHAMRYVLRPADTLQSSVRHYTNDQAAPPTSEPEPDDQPHIKYEWTIGKRSKFSCTVYYARQFDSLRHRCGVGDVFLKSLVQSANWAAEGGKSKSNFWKTSDERFIIKSLVNAWNVADLQVLIDLGPSYFRYMDSTAGRPTVLAKLLGFYTVEIRNLESGTVQSKADLLVMENLFYDQAVVKTFDLKGIQGRKVKARPNIKATRSSKTLLDGEWIEGQQRTLTLVHPHSKVVLREAIKSDAEFLAKNNIMDYSLLLGVDEEHRQIACGLVDTIGSYTFAKTLEYKAKQGLKSGEVTVIPPAGYQERFVRAIDRYFLACPDKWSRPLETSNDQDEIADVNGLPSVL